jgi:hypothetical protein
MQVVHLQLVPPLYHPTSWQMDNAIVSQTTLALLCKAEHRFLDT